MKASPIQLLQSTIDRISVEPLEITGDKKLLEPFDFDIAEFGFHRLCEAADYYWDDENTRPAQGIEQRTYFVQLGFRTPPPERASGFAYRFEVVCSGFFCVIPETLGPPPGMPAELAARQYGFAMLYGIIREQLCILTSRMVYGRMLLPTFSFMDETLPEDTGSPRGQPKLT